MTDPTTPVEGDLVDRPEPVLDAGRLAGLLSAVIVAVVGLVLLVAAGNFRDLSALAAAVNAVLVAAAAVAAYVLPVWQARRARARVTPLADPRDDAGEPLVVDVGDGGTAPPYVLHPQTPGVADHAAPGDAE